MKIWSTATLTVLVRSRSRLAVSLTGISSGSATIATPVFRWLVMSRLRVSACVAIGPTRATFANVFGVWRKPIPWPVAGASKITRSYGLPDLTLRGSSVSSHTLPMVTSSRRPGVAAAR